MSDIPQLERLKSALKSSGVEQAFEILDEMLSLQTQTDPGKLQDLYIDGLVGLLAKNPDPTALQEIDRRLRQTPGYWENPRKIEVHAQAILDAVSERPTLKAALATADSVAALKGYGASPTLQTTHANALFEVSLRPDSKGLEHAERIQQIPNFRDSQEIQFACARTCCNTTSRASNLKEIDRALRILESLPSLNESPALQESLERAQRNRTRFVSLGAAPDRSPPWKTIVFAGCFLFFGGGGVFFATRPETAAPLAIASPSPSASVTSPLEAEFSQFLKEGRKALTNQNYEEASIDATMALRRAKKLKSDEGISESLDLMASAALRNSEPEKAADCFAEVPPAYRSKLTESHLVKAEQAFKEQQPKTLLWEMSAVIDLFRLDAKTIPPVQLERAATLSERGELYSQASQIQEQMGALIDASRLAESAEEFDRALDLLQRHVEKHPDEAPRIADFQKRAGSKTLLAAEAAFLEKDLKQADTLANAALKTLEGVSGVNDEVARVHTVRAKTAFLTEHYGEAVALAKLAVTASPNDERLDRLSTYRSKDAAVVTRDELDIDTFVFPPAVKTGKFYTYAYYLGSVGDFVSGGGEELFQPPKDDLKTSLTYGRKERGVTVRLTSYEGRSYSFTFDAGGEKLLKPGLYVGATRAPFNHNNPGLDFSGNGRGSNSSRGKFVVHEIVWGPDREVASFAADFITGNQSGEKPAYGKVRYNSAYE